MTSPLISSPTVVRAIPHLDHPGLVQMITFRLTDALPGWDMRPPALREFDPEASRLWFRRFDGLLDKHHGDCVLAQDRVAQIVADCLKWGDGSRYELFAWAIMPNHVHVLIAPSPGCTLGKIVQSWKGFSAHEINQALGRTGTVWQRDYYDRYMRNERHFAAAVSYIEMNPVKAKLTESPGGYRWSSAYRGD